MECFGVLTGVIKRYGALFMEDILHQMMTYIQSNADVAPFLIFGLLLLAGFNLPVSEDLMLFTSALLARGRPDLFWSLFIGVFAGAYLSDLICYGLGRTLGPKLWKIKWFARMVKPESVDKVSHFYERFGIFTLILGRFVPFGVRNALFLTAGLGRMGFMKFALSDLLAATISCSVYFYLYFTYGEAVVAYIQRSNQVIFGVAVVLVVVLLVRQMRKKRNDTTP